MPGSKRRALKKLLSPNSTPSSEPISSTPQSLTSGSNSLAPVDSAQSNASIASDSRNYMTDAEIEEEVELERMEMRKDSIGSGHAPALDTAPGVAGSIPPVPPLGEDGQGLPPAVADAPPLEGQEDLLAVPTLSGQGVGNGDSAALSASPSQSPADGGSGHRHGRSPLLSSSPLEAAKGMYGKMMGNGHGTGHGIGVGSPDAGGGGGGGKKKSSKQKFAERQARKQQAMLEQAPPSDPHWDKQLEKERLEEVKVVGDACVALGRTIHEITPDGHCMYHAVADQLACIGRIPADQADDPKAIRAAAAAFMRAHVDDFRAFLPSVNGEDSAGATTHDGVVTDKEYEQYCYNIEHTGEWGGELEIQALSRAFQIPIHVIQRGPPTIISHGSADDSFGGVITPEQSAAQGDEVVRISYHRRMYGLGEHYNSLRKVAA